MKSAEALDLCTENCDLLLSLASLLEVSLTMRSKEVKRKDPSAKFVESEIP